MVRYETLILVHPEIANQDEKKLQNYFEELASNKKCELISFDKWGKYLLAYPVKKQDYGVFFLVRYALNNADVQGFMKDLQDFFKIRCTEFVMRFLNKRLEEGASLEYQKPASIEDVSAETLAAHAKEERPHSPKENIASEEVSEESENTESKEVEESTVES